MISLVSDRAVYPVKGSVLQVLFRYPESSRFRRTCWITPAPGLMDPGPSCEPARA